MHDTAADLVVAYDPELRAQLDALAAGGTTVRTDPTGRLRLASEREPEREAERRSLTVPRVGFGRGR